MRELQFNTDNLGGVIHCYAIPPSCYALNYDYSSRTYTLLLVDDTDVISIPVYADGTINFAEPHGRDEHGDYWEPSVSGAIPRASLENAALLEELERGEWVVAFIDQNGIARMAGDDDTPLTFATSADTGLQPIDLNRTGFTFSGRLSHPSYVVQFEP